jgi:hypothetical protein
MKTRWKILMCLAAVVALIVVAAVGRHYQLKASLNRYRAELKARGEKMELAEVVPPRLRPEENFAALFTNAFAAFTNQTCLDTNQPAAMRMVAPGKAQVGWRQPYATDSSSTTSNSWAEVGDALAQQAAGLEQLRRLPGNVVFDFDLNYSNGFTKMGLSPLAQSKKAVQRLQASAVINLHHGNTAAADKDIQTILAICSGISHDRTLISELVRYACTAIGTAATWEFLQSPNATESQLADLQRRWTEQDYAHTLENAVVLERVVGAIDFENFRRNGFMSYFDQMQSLGVFDKDESVLTPLKINYGSFMWRHWWCYPDEVRELQTIRITLESIRTCTTNGSFLAADAAATRQLQELGMSVDDDQSFWFGDPAKADFHYIVSSSPNAFLRSVNRMVKTEAARRILVTAIALKRFQLKNGLLPAALSELVPDLLPAAPIDPMDAKPLRYHRNDDGTFLLYSIGEDGVDDGGDPEARDGKKTSHWQSGRDWVWPQPVSEIQR